MDKIVRERIAKRVLELRTQQGISQQQLADAAHLSLNTIKGIEEAKFSVKTDILERIASCLGTRVDLV